MIALLLRSIWYVRKINVPKLTEKQDWHFRTKHELGVELFAWLYADRRPRPWHSC